MPQVDPRLDTLVWGQGRVDRGAFRQHQRAGNIYWMLDVGTWDWALGSWRGTVGTPDGVPISGPRFLSPVWSSLHGSSALSSSFLG